MDEEKATIVLVRMDKIGDLVVSMASDQHPACAGTRVHWFISSGLGFIPKQAIPPREFTEFQRRFSPRQFVRMVKWLREHRPRVVVLLHNPGWVSFAAWLAGVPERIGRKSRWHSYLFVNRAIAQSRSISDRHESDYNFDFLEMGFRSLGFRPSGDLDAVKRSCLRLRAPSAASTLAAHGLTAGGYRVVHPGMGGSALNWPGKYYFELIEMLLAETPVAITGTGADAGYLEIIQPLRNHPRICWLIDRVNSLELLDVLSQARGVVAPSTGVLHLAASLGAPALGIYSPRRVEHPRRWAPRGPRTAVVTPPVQETGTFADDVMSTISPTSVFFALKELEEASKGHAPDALEPN